MAGVRLGAALRQIHGLFEDGTVAGLTDGQLLDRYLTRRDESAFAALVVRHGPMVLGVCHAVLHGSPEVEDAFQATFLVLIRKAASIRGRDAVGGWLYRVAHRVAVEAGRDRARRDRRERAAGDPPDLVAVGESFADDDWRIPLHEELARLPERFRQPVVLCYLEGKTHAQAAFELKWSEATLRRRLADARGLLRSRLTRRGVAVSGGALAAALSSPAKAAVPSGWADALARVAVGPTTGHAVSAAATRFAVTVVRGLVAGQVRIVANVVTVLLAIGLVAGHLLPAGPVRADDPARTTGRPSAPAVRPSLPEAKAKVEETPTVRGRVIDPDGKPFAGAKVYVYRPDPRPGDDVVFAPGAPVPDAISDADGRFQFAMPEPGFQERRVPERWSNPIVVALAGGFGPAWASVATIDEARDLTLILVKDDVPIVGRIVDLEGRPMPGVTVRPVLISGAPGGDLSDWEAVMARAKDISDLGRTEKSYLTQDLEMYRWRKEFTATTGADGRFRMTGMGRERIVSLWIEGPTIATELGDVSARTRPGPTYHLAVQRDRLDFGTLVYYGATFEHAAAPTRPIEGIVRDKDSGLPLAGISIRSERFAGNAISGRNHVRTTTGADGRYRLVGMPAGNGNRITANPGPAQPYLGAGADVPGGVGTEPAMVDFALKRGVAIRGKVTDKATGQPVPAFVEYFVFGDNPHRNSVRGLHGGEVRTRPDGSFELEGLPGRGLVAARALKDHYLVGQGADKIAGVRDGGQFLTDPHICESQRVHTIVAVDPTENAGSLTCDLALDPGKTVSGTVVGLDGRPLAGCTAIDLWPHTMSGSMVRLASGTFTAIGLDPKRPRPLVFRHDEQKLTAFVIARGDEHGPLTVRLQAAGTITGRLLDDDGPPRRGVRINVGYTRGRFGPGSYDPYLNASLGADGRFRVEGLIPGVGYNLDLRTDTALLGDLAVGVKLEPGETRDLGDLKVKTRQ